MDELNAELVARLLDAFYAKVRRDPTLGPVFEGVIGEDWPAHMAKINLFWRTALRIDRGYPGRDFMPAHLRHQTIRATQLSIWLDLFEEALSECAPPSLRGDFRRIAEAMAENIGMGLNRRDGADSPP
jgi:hemoglobin